MYYQLPGIYYLRCTPNPLTLNRTKIQRPYLRVEKPLLWGAPWWELVFQPWQILDRNLLLSTYTRYQEIWLENPQGQGLHGLLDKLEILPARGQIRGRGRVIKYTMGEYTLTGPGGEEK